jgi:O-antigen/teichoic acid export membrane protein
MGAFGAAMAGLIATRLLAFCALLAITRPTPNTWSVGYGAASIAYVAVAAAWAVRMCGRPRFSTASITALTASGFPFAFAASAMRVHAEANKPILARVDSIASAGVFGAAQRVTDLILLPIQAMVATLAPRAYCRHTLDARTVSQLGAPCFAVALSGGMLLFVAAPSLPIILGESFAATVGVVRLLAFLPCLATARMLLTTLLTAQNRQRAFYRIYLPGVGLGLVVTVSLTMKLNVLGAVLGAYVSEVTLIALQAKAAVWQWQPGRQCADE